MPGWRCSWPKGFSARSRWLRPTVKTSAAAGEGEEWIQESWAGGDPDLAATQKAEQGLGKAREGPWF